MSRLLHGRGTWDGRLVDWLAEGTLHYAPAVPGQPFQYLPQIGNAVLTLRGLDHDTAVRVTAAVPGTTVTGMITAGGGISLEVSGIFLSEDEMRDITLGAHPVDVILRREGPFPDCGYRLVAVADPLLTGG